MKLKRNAAWMEDISRKMLRKEKKRNMKLEENATCMGV
jgi:hypothetical protein